MNYVMLSMQNDDSYELQTIPCGAFIEDFLSRFVGSTISAISAITSVFAVDLTGLSMSNPVLPMVAQDEVYFSGLPTLLTTCFGRYYLSEYYPDLFTVGDSPAIDDPPRRCRWVYKSTYNKVYDDFLHDYQTTPAPVDGGFVVRSDYNAPSNPFIYDKIMAHWYEEGPAPGYFRLIIPVWAYPYHLLWGPVSLDGFTVPVYTYPIDPWQLSYVLILQMPVDSGQYRGTNPLYGPPEVSDYCTSRYYQYQSWNYYVVECSGFKITPIKTQYIRPTHGVCPPFLGCPVLPSRRAGAEGVEISLDNLLGLRIID